MTRKMCTLLPAVLVTAAACGLPEPPGDMAKSDIARDLNPQLTAEQQQTFDADRIQAALDLYRNTDLRENTVLSPYSLDAVMAMLYAGANGDTKSEMATVLRYEMEDAALHAGFNRVDLALASRGEGAKSSDGGDFVLRSVNQLFGTVGFEYNAPFLDTLAKNYGAGLSRLDFVGEAEDSRVAINDWVASMTGDLITGLLQPGSIDASTVLVLVNAVYFDAAWAAEFREREAEFEGSKVPGFGGVSAGRYVAGETYEAVAIPYDGDEIELLIIEPQRFEEFAGALDADRLTEIIDAMERGEVDLTMPKFDLRSRHDFEKWLRPMGMTKIFDDADLSGIAGTPGDLYLAWIVQEAVIEVSEKGTVAAAATAGGVGVVSAPPPPVEVIIDRSFLYALRDVETGTILFIGHVRAP